MLRISDILDIFLCNTKIDKKAEVPFSRSRIHQALFAIHLNRTLKIICMSRLTTLSSGANFLCLGQNFGIKLFNQTPG